MMDVECGRLWEYEYCYIRCNYLVDTIVIMLKQDVLAALFWQFGDAVFADASLSIKILAKRGTPFRDLQNKIIIKNDFFYRG